MPGLRAVLCDVSQTCFCEKIQALKISGDMPKGFHRGIDEEDTVISPVAGHSNPATTPVCFAGRNDQDKIRSVQSANVALEAARQQLDEARQRWQNVTPAQKAGLKGAAGLILLALGSDKKQPTVVRTVALMVAAGLVGSSALDLFRQQKQKSLLSRKLNLKIDENLNPADAIRQLKTQLTEEVKRLNREITERSPLERRVEKEMRLLEIEVAQKDLDVRLARVEAGLPADEDGPEIR